MLVSIGESMSPFAQRTSVNIAVGTGYYSCGCNVRLCNLKKVITVLIYTKDKLGVVPSGWIDAIMMFS